MKKHYLFFPLLWMLLLMSFQTRAQTATVKGVVKSESGEGLPAVSVYIVERAVGQYTSMDGKYEIKDIPAGTYRIVIRSIGYQNDTAVLILSPGEVKQMDFTLREDNAVIDGVVVIGYGTSRTSDLTGSATFVGEKKFLKGSVSTPEQLIMGKVAGLKININDGAPGSGSTIRMRGGTSINASNDPLIVVDGVPLDNGGIAGSPNALSLINPNDIESFVILKDASAAAIYGSRAANGVIIITTKKGSGITQNALQVVVDSKNSLSTIPGYLEVLTGDEYRQLINEKGTPAQIALLGDASTDWQKEIYRTAFVTDNNVAVSGGIPGLPYRLSFGRRDEQGLLDRDVFKRHSLSINLSPSFLQQHLLIESNNRLVQTGNFFANRGALGAAYFDPTQQLRSGNDTLYGGYFEWADANGPNMIAPRNPVGLLQQRDDISNVNRYIGNLKTTYILPFYDRLRVVLNGGVDYSRGQGFVKVPATSASGYFLEGSFFEYEQHKGNRLGELYANFNNSKYEQKHQLDVTIGTSYQDWYTSSPNNPTYNEAQDTIIFEPASPFPFYTKNVLISAYGRVIYTHQSRYVLNMTMRRDGSSRFSRETRWGSFPSFSAAWQLHNEPFMRHVKKVNMLKIRAGYGVTGQQDGIGDYAYISNYFEGATNAQYAFGGQYYTVLRPAGYDASLKWETTQSVNLGLDFGLFSDRINGTIDLYHKFTNDLLAVVPVPAGSNFTNEVLTNVGSMVNRGIEVTTNFGLIARKNTRLDWMVNATYNLNEVKKLSRADDPSTPGVMIGGIAGGIGNTIQMHQIGFPTFSFFVYEQRYDANGKPIEVGRPIDPNNPALGNYLPTDAFVDRNGDGIINIEDRYLFRQAAPLWFLGTSLDFRYKKWFASTSVRAELGGYIYNNIHSNSATFQAINGTQGFMNNVSRFYYQDEIQRTTERQLLSDHYIEKANFLRVDNFSVGYQFGKLHKMHSKVGLNAAFSISNVWVFSHYMGFDPEINGGIDNNIYPRPRVYSLNLTFDIY